MIIVEKLIKDLMNIDIYVDGSFKNKSYILFDAIIKFYFYIFTFFLKLGPKKQKARTL